MTAVEARDARIARAKELILSRSYLVTQGAVLVYADSPGVAGYTIDDVGRRCDCPDATVGMAGRTLEGCCKHWHCADLLRRSHAAEAQRLIAAQDGVKSTDWQATLNALFAR